MKCSETFDLIIIGAGPAGVSCALSLAQSKLKILVVDKAYFPRDKICGDAISGQALKMLSKLSPDLYAHFKTKNRNTEIKQSSFYVNNKKPLTIQWTFESNICARKEFDHMLVQELKKHEHIKVIEGFRVDKIEKQGDIFIVGNAKSSTFYQCKVLVGADGANSLTAKALSHYPLPLHKQIIAVRSYFYDLKNLDPKTTEVYVSKKYYPGYFWIFPTSESTANVGFGILSKQNKPLNLKAVFYDFIQQNNVLAAKFEGHSQSAELKGHLLPVGAQQKNSVSDGYFLLGDAAALIDPISGDGIGSAMQSGIMCAKQIIKCFAENKFDKAFLSAYETEMSRMITNSLKRKFLALKLVTHMSPFLNLGVFFFPLLLWMKTHLLPKGNPWKHW